MVARAERHSSRPQIRTDKIHDVVETIQHLVHKDAIVPVLVLIGGCSQSGKSWLAERVRVQLANFDVPCLVVKLDNWIVSLDQRRPSSTVIERYDCATIRRDIGLLLKGRPIYPSIYDAPTRTRVCETSSVPLHVLGGVVLVEGVIALALAHVRKMAALRIFVDVDDSTRWRRLMLFYSGLKGIKSRDAERILREREEEEVPFVRRTRSWADLVFLNK